MSKARKPHGTHLSIEALEGREVPSSASLLGGVLTVNGTEAGEAIAVKLEGWQVRVSEAAILDGPIYVSSVDASRVRQVVIHGFGGDDTINVSTIKVSTMIWGGTGNDRIYGGGGTDTAYGDQGNDAILGASGDDWLVGGDGSDSIWGGAGNDWMTGDNGNDQLSGDAGNDSLFGGEGQDSLIGGSGADQFDGHGFGMGSALTVQNFDIYQDDFDLWRPLPNATPTAILRKGNLGDPAYLAALQSLSLTDLKANIRVVSKGIYDVTLPGDRRTHRIAFDGRWTDNDPMPVSEANPNFATILLNRARLISFGFDPNQYHSQADFDALNSRTGGRFYSAADALRQFTGRNLTTMLPTSVDFGMLKGQIDRGLAAVVSSFRATVRTANSSGVMGDTTYVVRRLFIDSGGRQWVELGNPLSTDRGDGGLVDRAPGVVQQNDGVVTLAWYDFQRLSNFTTLYLA
jgi:RTX calcium-binding nonapeptide repeat (4 copies)